MINSSLIYKEFSLEFERPWECKSSAELNRKYGHPHYVDGQCGNCGTEFPFLAWNVGHDEWSPGGCPFCGTGDEPETDKLYPYLERLRIRAIRNLRFDLRHE